MTTVDDELDDAEDRLPPPGEPEHADAVRELALIARAYRLAFDIDEALHQPLPQVRKSLLDQLGPPRLH